MVNFTIITAIPDLIIDNPVLRLGIIGKSFQKGLFTVKTLDLRQFTNNTTIDDYPFGGGPGLVIKYDPVDQAIKHALLTADNPLIVMPNPWGKTVSSTDLNTFIQYQDIIMICGRYDGIDHRIIEKYSPYLVSTGNIILSGGELSCLMIVDAMVRLLPGCLGNEQSKENETFSDNLISCPKYTRPAVTYDNLAVPKILLSGNRQKIMTYKRNQRIKETILRRPELINIK